MAAAAIFNHAMTAAQSLMSPSATPSSSSVAATADTSSTSSSDTSSATISANDFLSLLVTEMQNQDPTADTDPNEYINQLVNVNSLEQLIDINQNLSTALGNSSTSSSSSAGAQSHSSAASRASGNLSVPSASSAAHRVAHALDGRTHAQSNSAALSANGSSL